MDEMNVQCALGWPRPRRLRHPTPEVQPVPLPGEADSHQSQPDGKLLDYKLTRKEMGIVRWTILIMDEAHMARRGDSIFNNAFRNHLVWITGTPLMSNLRHIAYRLGLIRREFDPDLEHIRAKVGCLEGLWYSEYDSLMTPGHPHELAEESQNTAVLRQTIEVYNTG